MTEYTATVSRTFAYIGKVYKVYYHQHYLLITIVIVYIQKSMITNIIIKISI